jgi:molecular chaperone GrpE (heat shock protein)
MKKYTGWVWAGLVLVALIIFWPAAWPKMPGFDLNFGSGEDDTEEMMAQYEHELDSMKNIIGVYMDENAQLNLRINDLNGQIEDLEYTVRRRENTIANLKKETNEKVTAVSKFNSTDIYKFLSDRYKDSTQVK